MSAKNNSLSNKMLKPMLIFACVLFTLVLQFGFIFLIIALLPSMVAYFIDEEEDRAAFKVVLLCNFAATLPTLLPIIYASAKMERPDIAAIMMDVRVWLLIYSGAAAGWCLVFLCRFIARFFVIVYFDHQVSSLERFQKKLLAEWGDKILPKTE